MSGNQAKPTEAELRELAARGAAELGGVNGPRGRTMCNYVVACHYGERRQNTDTPYRKPSSSPQLANQPEALRDSRCLHPA